LSAASIPVCGVEPISVQHLGGSLPIQPLQLLPGSDTSSTSSSEGINDLALPQLFQQGEQGPLRVLDHRDTSSETSSLISTSTYSDESIPPLERDSDTTRRSWSPVNDWASDILNESAERANIASLDSSTHSSGAQEESTPSVSIRVRRGLSLQSDDDDHDSHVKDLTKDTSKMSITE